MRLFRINFHPFRSRAMRARISAYTNVYTSTGGSD